MAGTGYLGLNTYHREGFEFRFPPQVRSLLRPINAHTDGFYEHPKQVKCRFVDQQNSPYSITCIEQQRPLAILWGDSHAQALIPGLLHLQKIHPFGLMTLTAAQCPPVLDVKPYLFRTECDHYSKRDIEIITQSQPNLLIIASTYREPRYFWTNDYFEQQFSKTLDLIAQRSPHTKVVIIGPTPRWKDSPQSVFFSKWLRSPNKGSLTSMQAAYRVHGYDDVLARQAKNHQYQFINLWNLFCKDRLCQTRVGNSNKDFIAFDYGHLSQAGATYVIDQSAEVLLQALGLPQSIQNSQ